MTGRPEGLLFEAPASLVISRAEIAIETHAERMEDECSHPPPCVHAQGLRMALEHVHEAGLCSECGSAPGGHKGGCSVWATHLTDQELANSYRFRADARTATDSRSVSGGTTDFFGHYVSISTGALDPDQHGGAARPFGEVKVDGREYWLVPKDSILGAEIPDPMANYDGLPRRKS